MLSYRHSFHAGNYADVIKHIVVIEILEYLIKKSKPFAYIDTHAGAGLYDLASEQAAKLQEYKQGIARLKPEEWPELSTYFEILNSYQRDGHQSYYPGSPLIALRLLRDNDKAWLFELHSSDYEILKRNIDKDNRVKVLHEDGYKGLLALLPPVSRRGLVLIDPSYEQKTDFNQVVETVTKAYKKFSTGVYAIWYPVVERKHIEKLQERLKVSGIKNIQRYELAIEPDKRGLGMTAAGMIVINPPYILIDRMSQILPKLAETLGTDSAFWMCDEWVGE